MPKKTNKFEENIKQLEEIVNKLETGEATLEESIELYEKGVLLAKDCSVILEQAQQKVNMISLQE